MKVFAILCIVLVGGLLVKFLFVDVFVFKQRQVLIEKEWEDIRAEITAARGNPARLKAAGEWFDQRILAGPYHLTRDPPISKRWLFWPLWSRLLRLPR